MIINSSKPISKYRQLTAQLRILHIEPSMSEYVMAEQIPKLSPFERYISKNNDLVLEKSIGSDTSLNWFDFAYSFLA